MDEKLSIWKQKLKKKGLRWTKQRAAILKVLLASERPLSAQEILLRLQSQNSKLRLSTIYRNLNYFEQEQVVNLLQIDQKENKFELNNGHHHHLVCADCEEVLVLDCPLQNFEKQLSGKTDYTILEHRLNIFGICPDCKSK
ncbi:Fur family transcriptional regulator [Fuchsiella alkaliacetigena]|uniref:Fur family transcriptional regulator n=1 Tax=Fuchsiella alkaliacetigena TaxID=957042 RepID=UPI00200A924C|nr:transcriptional repressor [Fuchsiella alkaliacetigena]MCK8823738.1 transcriptional repressor [Fuchsiella alkaliacetigena]